MVDLSKFKGKKWYRQGGYVMPVYDGAAYDVIARILGEDGFINVNKGEKNHCYFDMGRFEEKAREHIRMQLEDPQHIQRIAEENLARGRALVQAIEEGRPYGEIYKLNKHFWENGWEIENFDPHGEPIVLEHLEIDDDEKAVLFWPTEMARMQKEQFELMELVVSGVSEEKIAAHRERWYFIRVSWGDGAEYTIEEIKKHIAEMGEVETVKRKITHMKEYHETMLAKREDLMKRFSEEQKKVITFFQMMTDWRDERKMYAQKTNVYIHHQLLRLEKETGIPVQLLKFLDTKEVDGEIDCDVLKRRSTQFANLLIDGEYTYFDSDDASKIISYIEGEFYGDVQELKGLIGNTGYAKGKVRVVMEEKDFGEFEEGEILVTCATRPEFVPIMKKASAIITDEGGITCHAAIVGRELGLPCIIGTQKATGILKTGMVVEVDADNGVVRFN